MGPPRWGTCHPPGRYYDDSGFPLLRGNVSKDQEGASLRIFSRTVLLLGPLPHPEREARALLVRHYSRYFARMVFVFIENEPITKASTCNTDFMACPQWPSREACWLSMIRMMHTAAHEPRKLESDASLLSTAPRLRHLVLSSLKEQSKPFDGFFYAHADLWINPFSMIAHFALSSPQHKFWFPRHRCQGLFA